MFPILLTIGINIFSTILTSKLLILELYIYAQYFLILDLNRAFFDYMILPVFTNSIKIRISLHMQDLRNMRGIDSFGRSIRS